MEKDMHIIKYKMDMDNGTISKEKYPVTKIEQKEVYDKYDGVYNTRGMSSSYFYSMNSEKINLNSEIEVDEKTLNHIYRSFTQNVVYCTCLEDQYVSELENDKMVMEKFQNILQTDLQKIIKEYNSYIDNYNSRVNTNHNLQEQLQNFIKEKENDLDDLLYDCDL